MRSNVEYFLRNTLARIRASTLYKRVVDESWRRRFLKLCVIYGSLFAGIGVISALVKLTTTRIQMLLLAVTSGSTALILFKSVQIFAESSILLLTGYIREKVAYEDYPRIYQFAAVAFLLTQLLVENLLVAYPFAMLTYYALIVRPSLNLLLFIYLGDLMQTFVYNSNVLQVLLQGVLINGFGNITKVVNNQVLKNTGFSITVFTASTLLINAILAALRWLSRDEPYLHRFKPTAEKFNTRTLTNPNTLIRGFTSMPVFIPIFLAVFSLTFLSEYYGRLKIFAMDTLEARKNLIVIKPSLLIVKDKQEKTQHFLIAPITWLLLNLPKLAREFFIKTLRIIPSGLTPDRQLSEKGVVVVTNPVLVVLPDTERNFVQYMPILREIATSHMLQIILFFMLLFANLFERFAAEIYGLAFLLTPLGAVLNAGYNASNLVELHHTLQAVDMALKKPTKDYSYTSMDYDSKQYIRIISQITFEPLGKLLGYVAGQYVVKNSLLLAKPTPYTYKVTNLAASISLSLASLWLVSAVVLILLIRRDHKNKKVSTLFSTVNTNL